MDGRGIPRELPGMKPVRLFLVLLLFAGIARAEQESAALPSLADLPVGITSFGATFHGNAIYVYGGQLGPAHSYSRDEVSKPLYRLAYSGEARWEELPSDEPALGPALLGHSSGVIRIGGMQPRNAKGEESAMFSVPFVRRFDPETGEWSKLPDLPRGRSSHDAWIVGDRIYVAGGWEMRGPGQSSRWAGTVEVLDLSAEKPAWRSIPQPFFRRALAVAVLDGELYCLGGLDKAGETSLEVDVLDLGTEEWRKGPSLPDGPLKGFGIAAGVERGRLHVAGFSGVVHVLAENGEWEEKGKLEHGRMFGRIVDPPEAPLVILGGAEKGGRPLALEYLP